MAELCREFGISRKTGYKIFDRYQERGVQGLTDRSRRPYRYANQLPFQVENYILNVKREHASWGARKIRERLIRRFSGIPIPAKSTIHAVLDRYGLVERSGRTRRRAQGTALSNRKAPQLQAKRPVTAGVPDRRPFSSCVTLPATLPVLLSTRWERPRWGVSSFQVGRCTWPALSSSGPWGIALNEWSGVGRRTKLLVVMTLFVLISSTVIVGYGNYIAQPASAVQAPSGH